MGRKRGEKLKRIKKGKKRIIFNIEKELNDVIKNLLHDNIGFFLLYHLNLCFMLKTKKE